MPDQLAQPNAYTSPQMPPRGRKFLTPKTIFLVLGILLAIEIVMLGIDYLNTPLPPKPAQLKPLTGASYELIGPKNAKLGEDIEVAVMLSTGGHTVSGADVILKYDPKLLEASAGGVLNGKIFNDYPASEVNQTDGVIRISGTAQDEGGVVGDGIFATINFKAKAIGEANVMVDFQKGLSLDSNIINAQASGESVEDILEKVVNLKINVQ